MTPEMPDDFSPEDSLARLRADIDQAVANAPLIAQMAHGYFEAYRSAGFTDRQALYLVAATLKDTPGTAPP